MHDIHFVFHNASMKHGYRTLKEYNKNIATKYIAKVITLSLDWHRLYPKMNMSYCCNNYLSNTTQVVYKNMTKGKEV